MHRADATVSRSRRPTAACRPAAPPRATRRSTGAATTPTATTGFSPVQASSSTFGSVRTSVAMTYPTTGEWDASYDLWFDPTPRTDGQNTGAEVMVWLNHAGRRPQPVGSKVGTGDPRRRDVDVWFGNTGWKRRLLRPPDPDVVGGLRREHVLRRRPGPRWVQRSWYLHRIQAGFEPWTGGTSLAVTSFSAGTGTATSPSPTPTPTPTSTGPRRRARPPRRARP